MKKKEILASVEEMFKGKKLIFLAFFLLLFFSGCIRAQPVEEQVSEPVGEQISEPEKERISVPLPNETISEEVIGKEISVERKKCSREFKPKFSSGPYYTGPLFDAHFHMPNLISFSEMGGSVAGRGLDPVSDPVLGRDVALDKILCNFEKENVKGAIGFAIGTEQLMAETVEKANSVKKDSSGKVSLFLMPAMFSTASLENIQTSNKGLFKGYGELAFYDVYLKTYTPDSQKFLDIYKVAGKHGLVVMMHPDLNQKSNIENVLKNNPNVNFLLHGFEIEDDVANLMDKYPNIYFSVDSAVLYAMQGLFMSGPKEAFISRFGQDFSSILNSKVNKWKPTIEQYPDRFMWGTDRGIKWHYDEDIGVLFEEFGRAFIGRLDPEVQEKFAYKNAEKLLQE